MRTLFLSALLLICLTVTTVAAAGSKNPVVLMETNFGTVKIELFEKEAPVSVKNFLDYTKNGATKKAIIINKGPTTVPAAPIK